MDEDKKWELLNDMVNDDGYYNIGGMIYDRDGNIVDTAEETAKAVFQIEMKQKRNNV